MMILKIVKFLQKNGSLALVLLLGILPGCKKPYEQFKRPVPTKTFREKQTLMHTIKKKSLRKHVKDMNLQEALEAKHYYEELGREDVILRLIPHIIALSKDMQLVAQLQLEFADRQLSSGELEEAQKLYTNFIAFYPGDPNIKAARYRQLLATFWTALEPDREQILILTAVDAAKSYLKDFPDDTEYWSKVHEILKTCYLSLLEGELGLIKFYLNKFSYERKPTAIEAARSRLEHSKEAFVPILGLYDERVQGLMPSLETIEKLDSATYQSASEQAELIAKQVALLEGLLVSSDKHYRVHPRDIF